ncbi:MAG: Outer membrane porin C [Candidatus Celerinatantimonas neptuna]|nr:MAG: Outer membrane porin C [Candidatus Celerinatantimonas neptuna]
MKKTILALAVPAALLVAGTATAANVYKTDTQSVDVYGHVEVDLTHAGSDTSDSGSHTGKSGTDVQNDLSSYGRLGMKGSTKVTDNMTAFGRAEWKVAGQNSDGDQFSTRYMYMGLDFGDAGNVKFGQAAVPLYTNVMSIVDIFDEWGYEAQADVYGGSSTRVSNQVIYSNDFGPVTFQGSYQFHDESGTVNKKNNYGTGSKVQNSAYSATVSYHTGVGLNVRAGYARQNYDASASKNTWAMGLDYTMNNLYLAALYDGSKATNSSDVDSNVAGYDLVAAYTMGKTRVYTGYGIQRLSGDAMTGTKTAINAYKLGAEYNFTSNFLSWVEYRHNNGSADGTNGYAPNEFAVSGEYKF